MCNKGSRGKVWARLSVGASNGRRCREQHGVAAGVHWATSARSGEARHRHREGRAQPACRWATSAGKAERDLPTSVWGGWVTSVLGQGRAKVQEDEIRETREVRY